MFQDETGGLELRDPQTGEFMLAEPEDGALVLNIGDMLGRFTNGKSSRHRSVATSYQHSRRLLQVRRASGVRPCLARSIGRGRRSRTTHNPVLHWP